MKYAIIKNGKVTAVAVWDGVTPWNAEGEKVTLSENLPVGPEWDYIDGEFVDNRPPHNFETSNAV